MVVCENRWKNGRFGNVNDRKLLENGQKMVGIETAVIKSVFEQDSRHLTVGTLTDFCRHIVLWPMVRHGVYF